LKQGLEALLSGQLTLEKLLVNPRGLLLHGLKRRQALLR